MDELADDSDNPENAATGQPSDWQNLLFSSTVSGAEIMNPGDRAVNYIFPVEVIVVGALSEDDHQTIERRIWTGFGEAFSQQNI
jgi:hypothetical protein